MAASPWAAWLLYQRQYVPALIVIFLAALTDWFDGFLARKLAAGSMTGKLFDPLADKVLVVTLFVTMGWLGLVPLWLLLLAVARDLIIVIGSLLLRMLRNQRKFQPSLLGKVSTFFQLVVLLLALTLAAVPQPWIMWLERLGVVLAAIFTSLSGLDYIRLGIEMSRLPPDKS